jgi:hypothetical protein
MIRKIPKLSYRSSIPKETSSIRLKPNRKIKFPGKLRMKMRRIKNRLLHPQKDSTALSGTCVIPGLRKKSIKRLKKSDIKHLDEVKWENAGDQRQCLEPIRRFSESKIKNRNITLKS